MSLPGHDPSPDRLDISSPGTGCVASGSGGHTDEKQLRAWQHHTLLRRGIESSDIPGVVGKRLLTVAGHDWTALDPCAGQRKRRI
jgi:hypothetical protein